VRVKALVEPRCGFTQESLDRCLPPDFDAQESFPCVRVVDHESRYINLAYDLATGQLDPCMYSEKAHGDMSKPWSEHLGLAFLNDQCKGPAYTGVVGAGGGAHLQARGLYYAENNMWYVPEFGCDETLMTQVWVTNNVGDPCTGPIVANVRLCPFQPVPDWVKELLPNPPYSLAVEYG
jgi:hypothetical protein